MAEGGDDEDKTEEPTPKKLRDAREKGQVAQSREVNTWIILFTSAILLAWSGSYIGNEMIDMMKQFIARPHSFMMDTNSVAKLMMATFIDMFRILAIPLFVLFVAAFLASFIQVGAMISTQSITPSLEKISPLKGAKRVFGSRAWIEFAKALIKMILVASVGTVIMIPIFKESPGMVGIYPGAMMDVLQDETQKLLIGVLSILFVFAVLDYGVQKYQLMKQLKMSLQEIKDEYKQTEGDPHIKAKLRELRMQRARRRMMQKVPTADVIITNPTHYAIALEYKQEKNSAPVVVAKGQDTIALKIREIAKENNVPIVENVALARAMYDTAELDQEIPEQHFKAVAEVISYVMSLKRR